VTGWLVGCNSDHTGITTVSSGIGATASADSATLSWEAPTTNADGSPLTDLAGYRIYYGTSTSDLSETIRLNGLGLQTYVIDNLATGTWYFAIKAVTSAGAESDLSAIVSKTI
jgi:Fibronectin type III domain